ncbi:hypothetical protein LSAT2_013066, partial [Lamellibrachia satsuma]
PEHITATPPEYVTETPLEYLTVTLPEYVTETPPEYVTETPLEYLTATAPEYVTETQAGRCARKQSAAMCTSVVLLFERHLLDTGDIIENRALINQGIGSDEVHRGYCCPPF